MAIPGIEFYTQDELEAAAVIVIQMEGLTNMSVKLLLEEFRDAGFVGAIVCLQPGERLELIGRE